jgi:Type IV secretion system pilin
MKKNLLKFVSKYILLFSFLILFPIITLAQSSGACPDGSIMRSDGTCPSTSGIGGFIATFQNILNSIVPVLVALGVVYFVWGVVQYVIADGEEAKKKGKDRMIYGVIGFAVIVGLWGLVNIVVKTFFPGSISAPTLAPLTGTAATCSLAGNPKFQDLLCYITGIINSSVIPLIFAIATVAFVWGVVQFFILNADEEAKRAQGKQYMIWGIIGLAVMLSVWGLVGIVGSTFGISGSVLPQVCPPGGCK